jgi:hypothetical protein
MFEPTTVGISRLTGDLVVLGFAPMVAYGIILLLSGPVKLSKPIYILILILHCCMLFLSATRSAYLCLLAFAIFTVFRGSANPVARRVSYGIIVATALVIFTGLSPSANARIVRETDSIDSLDGRLGLWKDLGEAALTKSPVIGLGYAAASRKYGLEYADWSGTAHSAFVEVLVGGGLLGSFVFIILWLVLGLQTVAVLKRTPGAYGLAACALLIAIFLASNVGEGIDAGTTGFTFWCVAAILPALRARPLHRRGSEIGSMSRNEELLGRLAGA